MMSSNKAFQLPVVKSHTFWFRSRVWALLIWLLPDWWNSSCYLRNFDTVRIKHWPKKKKKWKRKKKRKKPFVQCSGLCAGSQHNHHQINHLSFHLLHWISISPAHLPSFTSPQRRTIYQSLWLHILDVEPCKRRERKSKKATFQNKTLHQSLWLWMWQLANIMLCNIMLCIMYSDWHSLCVWHLPCFPYSTKAGIFETWRQKHKHVVSCNIIGELVSLRPLFA